MLTYGNITATLAVFLAISGTAAAVTLAPANSVVSGSIKDGEVKTPDVAAGAVTAGKLRDGAVTNAKIAANSIGSGKVVDGSLRGADIRDDSLGQSDLAASSVGNTELADNSVDGAKIGPGGATSSDIADYGILSQDIGGNEIGTREVKDLTTVTSPGTYITAGNAGSAFVTCPNGGMPVGGGFAWQDEEPNSIIYSAPNEQDPNHTWSVRGYVPSGSNKLYAWASCLSP